MATFTKVCFYCGHPFEASYALANICSPDCRRKSCVLNGVTPTPKLLWASSPIGQRSATVIDKDPSPVCPPLACARCRSAIGDATGSRKYCSRACRRAIQRKKRKAKIRSVYVEPVSMAILRRRDDDTCRICGTPVDFNARAPHPLAATIDHVVPLANGGEHSYGNTQLAHLRCNHAKGAG
jgi:5-methylcytosine-specific restriction endonuclease McrA